MRGGAGGSGPIETADAELDSDEEGGVNGKDAVEGAADPPYGFPNILVDYVRYEQPGITTGWPWPTMDAP